MQRTDLPDDPRNTPTYPFNPWTDALDGGVFDERPGGAGERWCHQVLGFMLGLGQGEIDQLEAELVDVWNDLKDEAKKRYMQLFTDLCPEETEMLFNKWYNGDKGE